MKNYCAVFRPRYGMVACCSSALNEGRFAAAGDVVR